MYLPFAWRTAYRSLVLYPLSSLFASQLPSFFLLSPVSGLLILTFQLLSPASYLLSSILFALSPSPNRRFTVSPSEAWALRAGGRGTYRHRKLKALRPASERTNSTAKDDSCILTKPKVRGLKNAGVLGQIAVMVVLLKRITRFIVKVTLAFRKEIRDNKSPPHHIYIPGPKVPKFILNLIQRE